MPRSVKDSDDDVEPKIGRRTRAALGTLVTDSPVRRSNRNKQFTKQTSSSPDDLIIETSASSTRSFRTRAGTADSNTLDAIKRLRSSKNSADADLEPSLETPSKKMTRRSIATAIAPDTPKTNTRPKRLTRAGSESKSTPLRTTRKTRASSMDPEPTVVEPVENIQSEVTNTPIKMKRRATILPSQSTVIEEEEKIPVVELEKMLIEVDETSTDTIIINQPAPPKKLESPKKNKSVQKNKNNDKIEEEKDSSCAEGLIDDSSESNRMGISENFQDDAKSLSDKMNTPKKDESSTANINDVALTKDVSTDSSHNFDDVSKEINSKDENVLNISKEKEKEMNSSNKENECSNINNSMSEQNKSIINLESLHEEISLAVMDTSMEVDKNSGKNVKKDVESNDNLKLDSPCLTESSVSSLDCNNTIISNSNVNTDRDNNLKKNNKRVSISNAKEISSNEEKHEVSSSSDEKENESSITILNESNTKSHKVLVNEENVILKEQSDISDDNNSQIYKTIIKEEQNLDTITQNKSSIKETNKKDEIEDKANASGNSVEVLTDTFGKEDNCINDVNDATEISNVENDEKERDKTAEIIPTCKNSTVTECTNCPINDNQDNISCASIESSLALEFSNDSTKDPSNDPDSTKCLLKLQSSELSNSISEKIDSSTVTESHDILEADLSDKEKESKTKSSSNTPVISKRTAGTESSILKSKEKKKKDEAQNIEDSNDDDDDDDVSKIKELFQDISADEWKQKSKNINIETQNNSIHSSTVKLETDSETECDLLLVDKKAWLAAEKLKATKDEDKFDYDSDDTIILKTKLDYLNDKLSNENKQEIKSKDSAQDSDTNSDIKENMEKSNSSSKRSSKVVQDKLDEVKENLNKSNDKSDMNVSSHSTSKKEKSRRSTSLCNVSKSELAKSLEKQFEEEEEEGGEGEGGEGEREKEISLSQKVSENSEATVTVDTNKAEVNLSQSNLTQSSLDKKQKKSRSLSSSLNSSFNSSINKSNKLKLRSKKRNILNISSSEEEENDGNSSENNKDELTRLQTGSGKKKVNQNYSTVVHIGSDSDTCNESIDSSNSDVRNKTPRIPRFLFEHKDDKEENEEGKESDDYSVEGKFSDISIDSDIKAEYNLDGKTDRKFSDDDIPGDECRASESEFSDPDDNGSDLADFVVDDDEVEEENEEGDEDEDVDEDEGEEIEVEDTEKEKDENEDEDEDEDEDEESEEEKENEEEDIEQIDSTNINKETKSKNTTISCEEEDNDINDERKNKGSSTKKMNISDAKSKKKKSPKQKISAELNFSESDEDRILSDTILELDISASGKKSKQKEELSELSEASQGTRNDTFTKKNKEPNISLTCSTPKLDIFSKQQLKHNTSKGENDRKSTDKVSKNEEQEKIHTKDLSGDNSETNNSTLTNSKSAKKKCSILSNSPANYAELFKDQTLPKALLSKKGHLNKTVSPCSETPTTKFLKKEKLNDSFPNIKLGEKENISKTTDINDQKKDATEEDENSIIIIAEEVTEQRESNLPVSAKRKRSAEMIDPNGQTELKNKKNKISTKLEKYPGSDNEKENSESGLKNDNEEKKRKRKKNKKNKNSKTKLETENIATTTTTVKQNMDEGEEMETECSNESKNKKKKKKKNKENIDIKDKNNEKVMNIADNDKMYIERESVPNKKKKKITSELSTLQVKEKSKNPMQKSTINSTDAEVSAEKPSSIQFIESKYKALEAAKRAVEGIKANRDKNKNKEIKVKKSDEILAKACTRGIKRLPADVIENLSDVPMNPSKKQKLLKKSMQQTATSHTLTTKHGFTEGYVTKTRKAPSNSGGTTDFDIVNLRKAKNQLKTAAVSFRNKMLSRNRRFSATSYIMYLHKQNASNKDRVFTGH